MFASSLPLAPALRPALNVGSVFDIPTGSYFKGKHGESILNSGIQVVNSIAGPGNTFKSEVLNYFICTALARYANSTGMDYDTENSMTYERLERACHVYPNLRDLDLRDPNNGRLYFVQSADILGDGFFEEIKKIQKDRIKNRKSLLKATPFLDNLGNYISIMDPFIVGIDSLTEFKVSAVQEKLVDANAVGESGANTQFMKDGAAKTQMITQLPNLGVSGSIFFFQVAHIGVPVIIDQHAPRAPQLSYSRRGTKKKGVPEKFDFINNNLIEIFDASKATNSSSDKSAKYPFTEADRDNRISDLMIAHMTSTRSKGGASGIAYEIMISQREGLLPDLTMFHYLRTQGDFGLHVNGNNTSFEAVLRPGVKLQRTTVREKLREDPKLCKAIEIATQMRQMEMLWGNIDKDLHCSPEALYEDITKKGYDWDILLDTRNYWVFNDYEKFEKPFLSTMDLLRMRKDLYKPWWYDKALKARDKQG